MWFHLLVLATSIIASTPAFVGAPLLFAEKYVLSPTSEDFPAKATTIRALAIADRDTLASSRWIPHFVATASHLIAVDSRTLSWCIEASSSQTGAAVGVTHCTGEPTQKWEWLPLPGGRKNQIQLQGTDQCLGVSDKEGVLDGALIKLRTCVDAAAELRQTQSWKFDETFALPAQRPSRPLEAISVSALGQLAAFFLMIIGVVGFLHFASKRFFGSNAGPLARSRLSAIMMTANETPGFISAEVSAAVDRKSDRAGNMEPLNQSLQAWCLMKGCGFTMDNPRSRSMVPMMMSQSDEVAEDVFERLSELSPVALSRRVALSAAAGVISGSVHHLGWPIVPPALAEDVQPLPLCDPCVTTVKSARGQEVTLVGTTHISEDSAVLVSRVIRYIKPDTVMIELDKERDGPSKERARRFLDNAPSSLKLADPRRAEPASAPPKPPPQKYGPGQILGQLIRGDLEEARALAAGAKIKDVYEQFESSGVQSGEEFVVAIQECDRVGATLLLGDQSASQTLRRLADAVKEVRANPPPADVEPPPTLAKMRQLYRTKKEDTSNLTREEVLSLSSVVRERESVRALRAYLQKKVPPIYEVLIGERDAYMTKQILGCPDGQRIVAVVGLAHVDGIVANILDEAGSARELPKPNKCKASA